MKKLYKYYSVSANALIGLTNGYVWQGEYKTFNDPFDGRIVETPIIQKHSFKAENVLCLSEEKDNLLMWAHYADGHRGFCVEFTDYADDELDAFKIRHNFDKSVSPDKLPTVRNAKPVQYKSSKEIEALIKDIPTDDTALQAYFDSLPVPKQKELTARIQSTSYIKHIDWKYEKEYRIINTKSSINCFPGKLTGIYFGMLMTSVAKRSLGMSLDHLNVAGGKPIHKAHQMYRKSGTYSLSSRKFDPKTDLLDMNLSFKGSKP